MVATWKLPHLKEPPTAQTFDHAADSHHTWRQNASYAIKYRGDGMPISPTLMFDLTLHHTWYAHN